MTALHRLPVRLSLARGTGSKLECANIADSSVEDPAQRPTGTLVRRCSLTWWPQQAIRGVH